MPPGPVMPRRGWNLGQSVNVLAAGATLMVVAFVAYGLWLCRRCWARNATTNATDSDPPAAVAKPGLSKEAIAKIPITSFASMGHLLKEGGNECCAVCLGKFGEEDDKIGVLPNCSHCFHTDCIDLWLYSHRTCPTCRSEFSLAEPVEHIINTG